MKMKRFLAVALTVIVLITAFTVVSFALPNFGTPGYEIGQTIGSILFLPLRIIMLPLYLIDGLIYLITGNSLF